MAARFMGMFLTSCKTTSESVPARRLELFALFHH